MEGSFKPTGRIFSGWRNRDKGEDWILPDVFFQAAQRRARSLGLAFPFTPQTLPAHLARIGFILPGNDGRHTYRVRIPGVAEPQRVFRIPIDPEARAAAGLEQALLDPGVIPRPTIPPLFPLFPPVPASVSRAGTEKTTLDQSSIQPVPAVPAPKHESPQVRARARGKRASQTGALITLDRQGVSIAYGNTVANEPHHKATDPALVKAARGSKKALNLLSLLDFAKQKGADQVFVTRSWALAAGLPADESLGAEGVAHPWAELPPLDKAGRGWTLRHPGQLRWSMWATPAPAGRTVELVLACYDHRINLGDETADTLAHSLAMFREATAGRGRGGFPYRQSPGRTFMGMWQAIARDPGALDITQIATPASFPPPAHATPEPAADLGWMRQPTEAERNATHCVVIDANSQYLRAMAGLPCGYGTPVHYDRPAFNRLLAGYWRLSWRAPDWPSTLPPPGGPLPEGADGWLTTETVAFLVEIGAQLDITEAWVWKSGRALDRLQARLAQGLYQLKAAKDADKPGAAGALKLLKTVYKTGVGQWSQRDNRELERPEPTHRPHWRHAIMARSAALLLRDLNAKATAHPVAIATDAFAFLTDGPPEALGLPIGPRLGSYTVERITPASGLLMALEGVAAAGDDKRAAGLARTAVFRQITGKDE